jgi:hypothetical protein
MLTLYLWGLGHVAFLAYLTDFAQQHMPPGKGRRTMRTTIQPPCLRARESLELREFVVAKSQ